MIPGNPQKQANEIEYILDRVRSALIRFIHETGYCHFEVDCSIINHEKDIVRVVLNAGTKLSVTVSRKQLGVINKSNPIDPVEKIMTRFEEALIRSIVETGYGHFEVDCSIINHEKDIVRVELTAGTKYSVTVSRKQLGAKTKLDLTKRTRSNRLGV